MSTNDSMPFECSTNPDTVFPVLDLFLYFITFSYLSVGLLLHGAILRMIFYSQRKVFKENSFFQIYAMDSIMSILLILDDILFNRLFLFVSPLCSLVAPFFYTPSILLKLIYLILHYTRFSKSIAQILMVLNRMSCVLTPANYDPLWRRITPIARVLVAFLPFGGIWNLIISHVYGQSIRGGFAINYKRAVQWAALSLFQSIYISTALFFTVICTSVTVYKLYFLPDRIKTAEKALCVTSFFISITFLFVAATQVGQLKVGGA
uniref:Serpentine receptor class gamma n=1 Tax=Caenorhabditis tropicalis TaxID=1561998 RepID=A0A1I7UGY9_9PELO